MHTITLYGKSGCCLCEDARRELLAVQQTHPFALDEVDIAGNADLLARYGHEIPVVLFDGDPLFRFDVDPALLRQRLEEVN
jgi:hypothetical protein